MLTLSKGTGTGGVVKAEPEDFVVKEITQKGRVLEPGVAYTAADLGEAESTDGKFTTLVLQKRDWNTVQALARVAKVLGRGARSIAYCGVKDKTSVSVQLGSIFGVAPEAVSRVSVKDIAINGAWRSNGVEMGANLGNAFDVKLRETTTPERITETLASLNGYIDGAHAMPNYFDRQRFGSVRLINFEIGINIMRGRFKEAMLLFLTDTRGEKNQAAVDAREKLAADEDYRHALENFPRYLKPERTVIEYMTRYDNPANALRKLPRGISLMFVHAVEALVFNAALEARVRERDFASRASCGKNFYGFPDTGAVAYADDAKERHDAFALGNLVGYETRKEFLDDYEKGVLEKLELAPESFKLGGMPELSMKGASRALLAPVLALGHSSDGADARLGFSIPAGSYATIFLNELTKSGTVDVAEIAQALR